MENISVKSVSSAGILWQARDGVTIRIVTADTLGAKYRKKFECQMIVGGNVVASTRYQFKRVMDRNAAIDRANKTGRVEFVAGSYSIAK